MNKVFKFCLYVVITASALAAVALSNPDVVNNVMPTDFSWLFAFLSVVLIVCAGTVAYLEQELEGSEVRAKYYMERYENYYSQSIRLVRRVAELERKDGCDHEIDYDMMGMSHESGSSVAHIHLSCTKCNASGTAYVSVGGRDVVWDEGDDEGDDE